MLDGEISLPMPIRLRRFLTSSGRIWQQICLSVQEVGRRARRCLRTYRNATDRAAVVMRRRLSQSLCIVDVFGITGHLQFRHFFRSSFSRPSSLPQFCHSSQEEVCLHGSDIISSTCRQGDCSGRCNIRGNATDVHQPMNGLRELGANLVICDTIIVMVMRLIHS